MRGLRRDADESQGSETVSEAHALSPQFLHGRSGVRIHSLGRRHNGLSALLCMSASAHCWRNDLKARPGSSPHDLFDHNVKVAFVEVIGALEHGVGPPRPTR